MMALVRICGQHRHAVERDLIALNWIWDGSQFVHMMTGTRLSVWTLASIVLASPPGTAVYHAETRVGPLTPEQQMMARSMGYALPGDPPQPAQNEPEPPPDEFANLATARIGDQTVLLDALPPDELRAKREEVAAKVRAARSRDKVYKEKYDPFAEAKRQRDQRNRAVAQQRQAMPAPPLPEHISGGVQGPPLPAHIAGEIQGPPLPDHIRGVS